MVSVEHYAFLQHLFKTNGIDIVLYLQIPADIHSFNAQMVRYTIYLQNMKNFF
jgi:hypothetical protein